MVEQDELKWVRKQLKFHLSAQRTKFSMVVSIIHQFYLEIHSLLQPKLTAFAQHYQLLSSF